MQPRHANRTITIFKIRMRLDILPTCYEKKVVIANCLKYHYLVSINWSSEGLDYTYDEFALSPVTPTIFLCRVSCSITCSSSLKESIILNAFGRKLEKLGESALYIMQRSNAFYYKKIIKFKPFIANYYILFHKCLGMIAAF
jgi:hypothetical protein